MNTFNEFELNKIKKLYADELASKLQRSNSSRRAQPQQPPSAAAAAGSGANSRHHHFNSRRRETQSAERLTTFMPNYHPHHQQQATCGNLNADLIGANESPFVDLNRYQRAFLKKATSTQSIRRNENRNAYKRSTICFGKALFDFQAKSDRELSLRRGDLLELLEILDHSWALVEDCQSGLRGFVPLNYIDYSVGCAVAKRDVSGAERVITTTTRATPQDNNSKYHPRQQIMHDLLPMSKGEPITLIRRLKGHWYEASNTRQAMGLVWSNDLDIIKQPVLQESTSPILSAANAQSRSNNNNNCLQRQADNDFSDEDDYENGGAAANVVADDCEPIRSTTMLSTEQQPSHLIKGYSKSSNVYRNEGYDQRRDHEEDDDDEEEEEEMLILESGERVLARRRRRARSASAGRACCNSKSINQMQILQHHHHHHQQQQQQQKSCFVPANNNGRYCCQQTILNNNTGRASCGHQLQHQQQMLLPRRSSSSPYIAANVNNLNEQQSMLIHNPASQQQSYLEHHYHQNRQQQTNIGSSSSAPATSLPRLCCVKFSYKPRQKDELELIVDDILVVVHECDDGWFIGSSYRTKQTGTFPGNFVESI